MILRSCFSKIKTTRQIHLTKHVLLPVEKSVLAVLRKRTGYALNQCKRALERHDNDLEKAEEWLNCVGKENGWTTITPSSSSPPAGLIGLFYKGNSGAIVEVASESTAVIRNETFQDFVALTTLAAYHYARSKRTPNEDFTITTLSNSDVGKLRSSHNSSTTLLDLLTCTSVHLGEQISVKSAQCVSIPKGTFLSGYAMNGKHGVLLGVCGALVMYKYFDNCKMVSVSSKCGKLLSAHIVGMNPVCIGEKPTYEKPRKKNALLHQYSIKHPDFTMDEYLEDQAIEVLDFVRLQIGKPHGIWIPKEHLQYF